MLHIADPEVPRRVERVRLAEKTRAQNEDRLVAVRAAKLSEPCFSAFGGRASNRIVCNDAARYVHRNLENGRRCDVAHSQFVRYAVFVEIVGGDCVSLAVLLTDAEPLDCFHAVMMVEGIDGENAHRVATPF